MCWGGLADLLQVRAAAMQGLATEIPSLPWQCPKLHPASRFLCSLQGWGAWI